MGIHLAKSPSKECIPANKNYLRVVISKSPTEGEEDEEEDEEEGKKRRSWW